MNLDMTLRELLQAHVGDLTPQPTLPAKYDSHSNLPAGCSRRSFNQRCKGVRGAHKIGHVWYCEPVAYHAACGRTAPPPDTPIDEPPDDYERALRRMK
jgi:hypothetical protein